MPNNLSIYRQQLNLQDATFTKIEHEDALAALVYKVTMPTKTSYILKICLQPHHYARELYFLTFFAGKLPIPKIFGHVAPNENINGAVLMEYFPGVVLKKVDLTSQITFHMGSLLAQIHNERTSGYGELTNPKTLIQNPAKPFYEKFQKSLSECSSHLSKQVVSYCEHYVKNHLSLLDLVDGPCIVHGDFRPGNIMALNGVIQGVIDWSASRAGFAEEDFCSLEYHDWATDPAIKSSFLKGYASIRPVPDYAKIMLLLVLSKALASMGWTIRTNTWNNKGADFYQMNRQFIENMCDR